MTLLLHSCCGPCLAGTFEALSPEKKILAFWENPNIHPFIEYKSRFESFKKLTKTLEIDFLVGTIDYGFPLFFEAMKTVCLTERCFTCYSLRLSKTAAKAKELGCEAFSTTLLISPYQKHELLISIGEKFSQKYEIPFFYRDLRPYFSRSRQIARELNLYRQKYCGCIFSEAERFENDPKYSLKPIEEGKKTSAPPRE